MTQADLARRLDVTTGAVSHWVKGRSPIPEERLEEIEAILGADLSDLLIDYSTLLDEARTPVGYAILWPVKCPLYGPHSKHVVPRSEEDFKQRMGLWAKELGVSRQTLEDAVVHGALLPITKIEAIGDIATHIHNPKVLARQAGFQESEGAALYRAVQEVAEKANTFNEAVEMLHEERERWATQSLHTNVPHAEERLDNGNENDDIEWWLRGDPAPEEFMENITRAQAAQDLTGRFKSGT